MDSLVFQANQAIVCRLFVRFNIISNIFFLIPIGGDNGLDGYPGLIGMKGECLINSFDINLLIFLFNKGRPGIPGERK